MTPKLTPSQLKDPAVMLETLKVAYQHVLDASDHMCGGTPTRLTPEQEYELGYRLALYWGIKT